MPILEKQKLLEMNLKQIPNSLIRNCTSWTIIHMSLHRNQDFISKFYQVMLLFVEMPT